MNKKSAYNQLTKAVAFGILCAIALALVMSAISAYLVLSERFEVQIMPLVSTGILVVSTFVGTYVATIIGKDKLAVIAGFVSGGIAILLICTSLLFFNGAMHRIIICLPAIICSSAASCLLRLKAGTSRRKKKGKVFR